MTNCHTIHNYQNLKYYRYWSVHDWILWEFIIYVKNNLCVGDRRIGEYEHIYKYVYLWNYISNKYKKKKNNNLNINMVKYVKIPYK